MLEKIFGKCDTEKRLEINEVLEQIYDGRFKSVERALEYHRVEVQKGQFENLVEIVLKVRQGEPRVLFEINSTKIVKYWWLKDLDGERICCVNIQTPDEWDRAVKLMVEKFRVDTCYGTIKSGITKFSGPDIYMFGLYEITGVIEEHDSNYSGCSYIERFLWVGKYLDRRELYTSFMQRIVDGEKNSTIGVIK